MKSRRYLPSNELDSTSSRLLKRLAEPDPEAWRELVSTYGPVVRFWIRRQGLKPDDLADVFQEVFLAVSRNIPGFQRQSGQAKFRAWLKAITFSKVQDFFRRNSKQPVAKGGTTAFRRLGDLHDESESHGAEEDANVGDAEPEAWESSFYAHQVLKKIRGQFQESTWQAFYLTTIHEQSSQQVAAELNMTPVAVRQAKFRVLQKLRKEMGAGEPENETNR
ncbi:MAG: sigma-70 family RNA polymerase sigma factor [Planctomycetaceae bacterium]|nr:sigma-70 family RNA polymerase sigma factor [Planctomycetaceae bacterium]